MSYFEVLGSDDDAQDDTTSQFLAPKEQELSDDWASVPVPLVTPPMERCSDVKRVEEPTLGPGWKTAGRKRKKAEKSVQPSYQPKQAFSYSISGLNAYRCYGYVVSKQTSGAMEYRGVYYLPHRDNGPAYEYADGSYKYYRDGKVHRDDGPAIFWAKSQQYKYFIEGVLTRRGGPAILTPTCEYWYQNGKLHRDDGPAFVERENGVVRQEYYHNGVEVTKDETSDDKQ